MPSNNISTRPVGTPIYGVWVCGVQRTPGDGCPYKKVLLIGRAILPSGGEGNSVTNAQAIKELENLSYLELQDIKIENLDFLQEVSVDIDLSLGGLEITNPFDVGILKRFKKCQYEMICVNGEFI